MPKLGTLELYNVEAVAQKLGTHPETVRSYIRRGKLEARRFGKHYWIPQNSLNKYFNEKPIREVV